MPVAAIVLFLAMLLLIAVTTSAINANTASKGQQYRNRALAVADAGLQAADNRLTRAEQATETTPAQCFTYAGNFSAAGSSGCAQEPEAYGSLGRFSYTVTPLTGSSAPYTTSNCTGWPVTPIKVSNITQYCITSTGTYPYGSAQAVTRRVEERVVVQPALWPVNGIYSLSTVTVHNGTINGDITASGNISLNNSTTVTGTVTSVSGTIGGGFTCGTGCAQVSGGTAPTYGAVTATAYANAYTNNNDAALTSQSAWSGSCGTSLLTTGSNPYNASCSGSLGTSSSPLLIPRGTYYFCNWTTSALNAKLTGGPVYFYIDSPYRTGSPCASGTGNVVSTNGFNIVNTLHSPASSQELQFFAYGCPTCTAGSSSQPKINITNGQLLTADWDVPASQFIYTNGTAPGLDGSILADYVSATNGLVISADGGGHSTGWVAAPVAWAQCPASPTSATDPNSGCY